MILLYYILFYFTISSLFTFICCIYSRTASDYSERFVKRYIALNAVFFKIPLTLAYILIGLLLIFAFPFGYVKRLMR